ncbi:MAG: hypothetical protein Q9175_002609 [Cornicularia normoerica]
MGDLSSDAARAEMQSLILQPILSRVPPLNGISREQKLAYAAFHLEQHEQNMKDKIRETALCAQEYANEEAGSVTFPHIIRHEPHPDQLRVAMRDGWKSHKPKPVVKTSRRSQPVFGVTPFSEHVGIAKRAIEELDSYDAQSQPTLSAIQCAQDSRNTGHFSGSSGAPTPIVSVFQPSRQVERDVNYDATRDPRVRDPRASL